MITWQRPRKFWIGKKRIACKAAPKNWTARLSWGLSLKIGDLLGTCEGCNRTIGQIEYIWSNYNPESKLNKGTSNWLIVDIVIHTTIGTKHYLRDAGCLRAPFSNREIIKTVQMINIDSIQDEVEKDRVELMQSSIKNGIMIINDCGEFLPHLG